MMEKMRKILTYLLCISIIMAYVMPAGKVSANEIKQYVAEDDGSLETEINEEYSEKESDIQKETEYMKQTETTNEETSVETHETQDETAETDSIVEESVCDETDEVGEISQIESESVIPSAVEEIDTDNEEETAEEDAETIFSEENFEGETNLAEVEVKEISLFDANNIASGSYENIVWIVDENGKLIIEGTGDYSDGGKAPWAGDARTGKGGDIKSAEVRVTDITSTAGMFSGLYNLKSVDLSGLDTSRVTNMSKMFYECENLIDIDVSGFDTSRVTDMSSMFEQCLRLTSIDMSKCDMGKVTDMSHMFDYCWHIKNIKFGNYDTSQLTNMSRMFYNCLDLENLDLSMIDTGNVTNMSEMFSKCSKLKNINLEGINTENVTSMNKMFFECNSLIEFDARLINTKNLTDMSYMFGNCSSLRKLDFSGLNLDNINIYGMFSGCTSLVELNLGNIKRALPETFANCSSLVSLDLKDLSTKDATSTELMFYNCSNLESLDISSFDTSSVVNMKDMFYGCRKLKSLDLSNFDMSKVITGETKSDDFRVEDMLFGCDSLGTIYTPCNLSKNIHIKLPAAANDVWYKEDGTQLTELPQELDHSIIIKKNEIPNNGKEEYTLNYHEKSLIVGDKFTLMVLDKDGCQYIKDIIWNSSDDKVATVSLNGEVLAIAEGTATITAKISDDIKLKCEVIIKGDEKPKESLYIEEIPDQIYTGKAITPQLKIYYNKILLVKGTDYTVSYKNNIKVGSAVVTIKGKGNLAGSFSKTFEIVPKNIGDADVIVENVAYNYDNKQHKKAPTIIYNGKTLNKDRDFIVEYGQGDFTAEGTYGITIRGIGNFTGASTNAQIVITYKNKNIEKAKVSKLPAKSYNNGKAITLSESELIVTLNGNILKYNTDYQVRYSNNTNVGKAIVIIQGIGEYAGTKKTSFSIKKQLTALSDSMIKNKAMFATMPIMKGGCTPEPLLETDGDTLVKNIDYTVSYKNNKKTGAAAVIIKGKGAYKGSLTVPFIITAKSLESSDLSVRVSDKPYVGRAGKYISNPTITDADGNMLKLNKDYVVESYTANGELLNKKSNPDNGTKITVKINGKGSYTGSTTVSYMLRGIDLSKAQIKVQTKNYTGSAVEISDKDITKAVIKSGQINKTLVLGQDYEIVAYYNNVRKGTATVVFKGIGDYSGEKSVKFRIGAWSFWG